MDLPQYDPKKVQVQQVNRRPSLLERMLMAFMQSAVPDPSGEIDETLAREDAVKEIDQSWRRTNRKNTKEAPSVNWSSKQFPDISFYNYLMENR